MVWVAGSHRRVLVMRQLLGLILTGTTLVAVGVALIAPNGNTTSVATAIVVLLQLAAMICFYWDASEKD